jgi:DNA-binding protein HU-beta
MTSSELIAAVAESAKVKKAEAERIVKTLCSVVKGELVAGRKAVLGDLGVFKPVARAGRSGRNPQTGAAIQIQARKSAKFTLAKALKEALR